MNFPRVLSVQDLSTTGLAFVNTSPFAVTTTFNFYGADGTLTGQSQLIVPAKGQVAKLASEILSTVNASSWIQVSSTSPELQGFELAGDFASFVDGAGPAPEATQLSLIDFSKEDILHIINPNSLAATVQLTLNAANGDVLTTRSVTLTPFQPMSFRLGDLNDDDNIDLISISANIAISASLTTKLAGGSDVGVTNAAPTTNAPSELLFPFAPSGPQGSSTWKTLVGIANIGTATQTVSITFNPDGGAPITVQRSLSPKASVGDSVANLFSLSSTGFTGGWIRVSGSGALAGVAAYQDSANGSLAVVPSQTAGATRFLFGHIASLSPWYTGLALLNTTATAANVEVYAIEGSGELVASASFTLAANTRRTALLSEFAPQVLRRAADGGWVFLRTTNNVPLLGFELFGHSVFPVLANVQGFPLPSTSTFTPPIGATSVSGVTITQVTFTDGARPKLVFKPQDPITYVANLTNSSGATGTALFTFTLIDPLNQTLFSSPLSIALPAGGGDVTLRSYIPSNALTGAYTVVGRLTIQGQTAARAGSFDVTGGASTPTAGQDPPIAFSGAGEPQFVYRPGDLIRFLIPTANFTGQAAPATVNYQLIGPGGSSGGSGTLTFTMLPGLSAQIVDTLTAPSPTVQSLYALSSTLTAGGTTSTKSTPLTIAPKSSAEAINVDSVFVTDNNGIPRGGFTPGSVAELFVWRVSTFPVTTPATLRYTVTGPNASSILDQPLSISAFTGGILGVVPLPLSSAAAAGDYKFQGTALYQDTSNVTKTSTLDTTFTVGPTVAPLKQTLSAFHPFVMDVNLVDRLSFNPGEPLLLGRAVYSTFTSPVTGTVQYQITGPVGLVLNGIANTTFNPGMNSNMVVTSSAISLPAGSYILNTIATAQGESSGNTVTFEFAGGPAPSFSFGPLSTPQEMLRIDANVNEIPVSLHEVSLDDRVRSVPDIVSGSK